MVAVIFRFCFYEANAGEDFASLQKITLYQKSRNPVRENTNLLSITVLYPETEWPTTWNGNKEEKMKTKKFTTTQLTMLGLMAAVLLLMAYTPLGYLNIGPLAISFNVIPVAISAVVLGPTGGAIAGAIFGLTSFGQCIGLGGTSAMGAMLFSINPVLAFIQRFVPRLLDGICLGYIYKAMRKKTNVYVSCAVTGFFSAFLNTLFFMTALVGLFGNTEYVQGLMGGRNIIIGCCMMVGINAVCEMVSSTVITGAVGAALSKAHLIPAQKAADSENGKVALER